MFIKKRNQLIHESDIADIFSRSISSVQNNEEQNVCVFLMKCNGVNKINYALECLFQNKNILIKYKYLERRQRLYDTFEKVAFHLCFAFFAH